MNSISNSQPHFGRITAKPLVVANEKNAPAAKKLLESISDEAQGLLERLQRDSLFQNVHEGCDVWVTPHLDQSSGQLRMRVTIKKRMEVQVGSNTQTRVLSGNRWTQRIKADGLWTGESENYYKQLRDKITEVIRDINFETLMSNF